MDDKTVQNDEVYEYAFEEVPQKKRKGLISLIVVLTGYPLTLLNFVYGGQVGVGLSLSKAILVLLVGNAFLLTVVILTGIIAFKTGLSTAFLSKRAFGKSGSHIFSLLLAGSAVTFVAMNGDIFARMIKSTFASWPIPVSVTAVIVILVWVISAMNGYKGLFVISSLGVPAAFFFCMYGVYAAGVSTNWFEGVTSYVPENPMTFSAATAAIVGSFIFGSTITPDVLRYAKSKLHVVITGFIAFFIGCFCLQLAGAFVAISTGEGDFTIAMASLGLGLVAFIAAIFAVWTTQDNNIYGASLAIQNIIKDTKYYGKIKHSHIASTVAILAAILAFGGIYTHVLPIIQFLSLLVPPVPAIIISEEFFVKNSKSNILANKSAILSWFFGGLASYICLKANFFVPPIIGILTAGILYILFEKIKNKKIIKGESKDKAIG